MVSSVWIPVKMFVCHAVNHFMNGKTKQTKRIDIVNSLY